MICPKCQKELPEESLFCSGCGYSFRGAEKLANKKVRRKKCIKISVIVLTMAVALLGGGYFVNEQIQLNKLIDGFRTLVEEENYKEALTYYEENEINSTFTKKADALIEEKYEEIASAPDVEKQIEIFNSGILTDSHLKEIKESVLSKLEQTQQSYESEKSNVSDVKTVCDSYAKYNDNEIANKAKSVIDYCQKLEKSRNAYKDGIESAEKKDYKAALQSLDNVIIEDSNYELAKKKREEIIPLYKKAVMSSVKKDVKANSYLLAISELEALSKYCSDSDVSSKLDSVKKQKKKYDEEQEKIKIEGYKNSQEVTVASTRVYDGGYYTTFMRAEVKIKNNTKKTAKDVEFGLLLFDRNGYPVDVEWKVN